jgi:phage shock protein PspC (stress-responsive transcriptional regulator)
MKKTISININGVIFHIEEDGYDKLKGYLNSIQSYFSSFADSKEIVSDIESRISERFLVKQKNESKQVISLEDVDELIGAMGTVSDFEAIEQAEDLLSEPLQTASSSSKAAFQDPEPKVESAAAEKQAQPKKLVRDLNRKLLGGVAAGLAHYFSVDPLWVRLGFLLLVMGFPAFTEMMNWGMGNFQETLSGTTVVIYLAMWIAFPGVTNLEEDTKIKKFYRDADRKVIGGVAGGIASYFGLEVSVVRFLGVLSIFFFGVGVISYFILWIIAPAARTLTEKMEMKGEPITLSNIESKIKKKDLNSGDQDGKESPLTQALLLPFRLVSILLTALGNLLKTFGPIVRWVIGVALIAISVIGIIGLIVAASFAMGMKDTQFGAFPMAMTFVRELPWYLLLSSALILLIPLVFLLLLGITLISNRKIVGNSVWLTLVGFWIVGIIGCTISSMSYYRNFTKRTEIVKIEAYKLDDRVLLLDQNNNREEDIKWERRIWVVGYDGDSLRVEKKFSARGSSVEDARKNALDLKYQVVKRDTVLIFDEEAIMAEKGKFRDQKVVVDLFIPYGKPFSMTKNFYFDKFQNWDVSAKYDFHDGNKVNWNDLRWVVTRDSGFVCINIPAEFIKRNEESNEGDSSHDYSYNNEDSSFDLGERGRFIKQFPVSDFDGVELGGAFRVEIQQGSEFSVRADGEEDNVDNVKCYVSNGTLKVELPKGGFWDKNSGRIGLIIVMPELNRLNLSGASKTRVSGFDKKSSNLDVVLAGASKAELNLKASRLKIDLVGASYAVLKGSAQDVEGHLAGACKLKATDMKIVTADLEAAGASHAELGVVKRLRKQTTGVSSIEATNQEAL